MKLSEKERQLRDEIAMQLYIRKAPDKIFDELYETVKGSFDAAEEFIKAQREKHKEDEKEILDEYLTRKQAKEKLGITNEKFHNYTKIGILRGRRFNDQVLYHNEQVKSLLKDGLPE